MGRCLAEKKRTQAADKILQQRQQKKTKQKRCGSSVGRSSRYRKEHSRKKRASAEPKSKTRRDIQHQAVATTDLSSLVHASFIRDTSSPSIKSGLRDTRSRHRYDILLLDRSLAMDMAPGKRRAPAGACGPRAHGAPEPDASWPNGLFRVQNLSSRNTKRSVWTLCSAFTVQVRGRLPAKKNTPSFRCIQGIWHSWPRAGWFGSLHGIYCSVVCFAKPVVFRSTVS